MIRRRTCLAEAVVALADPARAAPRLRKFELYDEDDQFSLFTHEFEGRRGLMASHLKMNSVFFLLSNTPLETRPFRASEDASFDSIILAHMGRKQQALDPGILIVEEGTPQIGPGRDQETGFVSKVRPVGADFWNAGR